MKEHDETPESTMGPTDRRTLNVMLGTGTLNQIDQTRKSLKESRGIQGEKKEFLPLPLRILRFIGGIFLALGIIGLIAHFVQAFGSNIPFADPLAKIGLAVGIPVYGGMVALDQYLDRRDWIRRINEQKK